MSYVRTGMHAAQVGSARFHDAHMIAFDTLPRRLYLHSRLRLRSLYFSRVTRIFEDEAVSRPEIQRIIDACEPVASNAGRLRPTAKEMISILSHPY